MSMCKFHDDLMHAPSRVRAHAHEHAASVLHRDGGRRLLPRYQVAGLSDTMVRSRPRLGLRGQNNGAAVQTEQQRARRADLSAWQSCAGYSGLGPSPRAYNGGWEVKSARKWRGIPSML